MEFSKVVAERGSCKKYDGRKVEEDKLMAILNAGRMAPTAKNLQEQHIYVVEAADKLALIDECTPCRYNAGTVLVVAYNKDEVFTYPGGKYSSGAEDATIVATHLMLAAQNEGINSCWVNCFDPDVMAQKLGLPANEEIVMILDLGYAASDAVKNPNTGVRKSLEETVTFLR